MSNASDQSHSSSTSNRQFCEHSFVWRTARSYEKMVKMREGLANLHWVVDTPLGILHGYFVIKILWNGIQ